MGFKNHETREAIIDHVDNSHVYFKVPNGIRISKRTFVVEKLTKRGYEPCHYTWSGTKKRPKPAISRNFQLWNVCRLLATAFIPNPNGFKFVVAKDGNDYNLDISNLEWMPSTATFRTVSKATNMEERVKAIGTAVSHTKEYFDNYNRLKGIDGLTHSERYRKRMRDMGYVLVPKDISPTGRGIWVPLALSYLIRAYVMSGRILERKIYDEVMEMIKNVKRINKLTTPKFDYEGYVDYIKSLKENANVQRKI